MNNASKCYFCCWSRLIQLLDQQRISQALAPLVVESDRVQVTVYRTVPFLRIEEEEEEDHTQRKATKGKERENAGAREVAAGVVRKAHVDNRLHTPLAYTTYFKHMCTCRSSINAISAVASVTTDSCLIHKRKRERKNLILDRIV